MRSRTAWAAWNLLSLLPAPSCFLKMTISLGKDIMLILLQAPRWGYNTIFICSFVSFIFHFVFMGCLKCGKIKGEEKSHQIKGLKKESGGGSGQSAKRKWADQIDGWKRWSRERGKKFRSCLPPLSFEESMGVSFSLSWSPPPPPPTQLSVTLFLLASGPETGIEG